MIKEIPINDNWLYRRGFDAACLESSFEWTDSFIVQLPHNVNCGEESYYDEREMRLLSTYSRVLTVPDAYNGKRLLLRLEGILSYVEVYVNGIFVTSHKGEAPFVADITAPVKYNHENRIVLKVDSSVRADSGSGTRGPATLFGGVCRDAMFMISEGRDIRDVCVRSSESGGVITVTADVDLYDYYPGTELEGEIVDSKGKKLCTLSARSVMTAQMRIKGDATGAVRWEPDNPVLYTAVVRLKSGNKILDCRKVEFGFVSAVFKREGFFLNGKQMPLIGLVRADSYPTLGRSATAETERRDARIIKATGCNAVRTMGQASRDFIDECNRIGLMVIEDIYGDGTVGGVDWKEWFVGAVTDMVLRDRNCPCVIGWGVRANNSADCDELYFKAHKAAKEADPTRATVGARNFIGSRLYEDVFAYNEVNRISRKKRKSGKLFVPYIIGEHCGNACPASHSDGEAVRLEQALRHLEAINDVLGGAALGAFGMSFCDFAAGRGHGRGDNVNHYGVYDGYRNPKLAAYAYLSQGEIPVMELSSNLSSDDFGGKLYVFTNADSVVLYRNGEKVGEFYPDRKNWQHLKHPPVVIDDFCGNLPVADVGEGNRLTLFKSILRSAEQDGILNLGFLASREVSLLRMLTKMDMPALRQTVEKYMRIPPEGATYRLEGVFGGEVKVVRTLSPNIKKVLRVEHTCPSGALKCTKSYERIAFMLRAEDGFGNALDYCNLPVTVRATGSLSTEGSGHLSLSGGRGGFYVRSISSGPGRVTVISDWGKQEFDFVCGYEVGIDKV